MSDQPVTGWEGRRLLVVGATSGIGVEVARRAVTGGARVVGAGRRVDRLRALADAGAEGVMETDVTEAEDCRRLADTIRSRVSVVDAVVHCAGVSPLRRLDESGPDELGEVVRTNLIGANNIIRAVLPVLAPDGVLAVLSSDSVGRPPYALGGYAASKAALETMMHGWRVEVPEIRFATIALGPTYPTGIGDAFDPAAVDDAAAHWNRDGFAWDRMADTGETASVILDVVSSLLRHPGLSVEHLLLRSPGARSGAVSAGTLDGTAK